MADGTGDSIVAQTHKGRRANCEGTKVGRVSHASPRAWMSDVKGAEASGAFPGRVRCFAFVNLVRWSASGVKGNSAALLLYRSKIDAPGQVRAASRPQPVLRSVCVATQRVGVGESGFEAARSGASERDVFIVGLQSIPVGGCAHCEE